MLLYKYTLSLIKHITQMTIKFIKTTDIGNHKIKGGTTELQGFKKLNIFVGKNNSGKSRFLRHLINKRAHLIDQQNNDLQKNVAA